MSPKEKEMLNEAFNSNWIAPIGPHIDTFEKNISEYLKRNYSCALSSGTAALHLALRILGIGKGDKVICPSLTFAATANAIKYQNAVPIFVDVCQKTWTIDLELLELAIKKHNPKALISVDIYGNPCNYDRLIEVCKKNNIFLIEDAAEALGSDYQGKKCGAFGDISILSFNGNKIITTSGGGSLTSDNPEYVKKAKFLSTQAREDFLHYEHRELGFNYRMSNLLASVGIAQLSRIDNFVKKRRSIFDIYQSSLSKIESIQFLKENSNSFSNRWLTTFFLDTKKTKITRDKIIDRLESEGIESRPVWKPMHMQPYYKKNKYLYNSSDDISKKLFENGICLPSGSSLSTENQNRIIDIIIKLFSEE